jgi:hypothetical protein
MDDNNLIIKQHGDILEKYPEIKSIATRIQEHLPEINRARENFGKTQSQFMDNMLTVSHPTTLRNMHQIAAEVEKTMQALREAFFRHEKQKIKLKMKSRRLQEETDPLKKELLEVSIAEINSGIERGEVYISGAIRKVANYMEQYNRLSKVLMKEQGVSQFSELDFEQEEEKYHIMKAFEQALCAARSRGGAIDEGNHIYFQQIGINGAAAQVEVLKLLHIENKLIERNETPPHALVRDFLQEMAKKFKGCSLELAEAKGMTVCTPSATVAPKLTK